MPAPTTFPPPPSASSSGPGSGSGVGSTGLRGPIPRDARLMALILASMGLTNVEPDVLLQLLEFAHRYTYDVLSDALVYSDHAATRQGTTSVGIDDVTLAIQSRVNYSFTSAPDKDTLLSLASSLNSVPLPPISDRHGVRLPPQQHCLTNVNFTIVPNPPPPDFDEEEEEGEEEQGMKVGGGDGALPLGSTGGGSGGPGAGASDGSGNGQEPQMDTTPHHHHQPPPPIRMLDEDDYDDEEEEEEDEVQPIGTTSSASKGAPPPAVGEGKEEEGDVSMSTLPPLSHNTTTTTEAGTGTGTGRETGTGSEEPRGLKRALDEDQEYD